MRYLVQIFTSRYLLPFPFSWKKHKYNIPFIIGTIHIYKEQKQEKIIIPYPKLFFFGRVINGMVWKKLDSSS